MARVIKRRQARTRGARRTASAQGFAELRAYFSSGCAATALDLVQSKPLPNGVLSLTYKTASD
jgi:hypothetical protein